MSDVDLGVLLSLAVAGAGAAVMGATALRRERLAPDVGEFLDDLGPAAGADEYQRRLAQPFGVRAVGGLVHAAVRRMERLLPRQYLDGVERQLLLAGLAGRRRPAQHLALQLALAGGAGMLVTVLLAAGAPGSLAVPLLGLPVIAFMLPAARLKRAARTRAEAIFKDLPDTLDLLAIAVEAGTGFEGALDIVCRHFRSPLAEELAVTLRAMELGLPRRQALQELKRRVDVPEIRSFVLTMIQADSLGIPIGRVLKAQATEMRARRRAWAREKAAKLPVKILFPLVLFIFPPILAIVLGPAMSGFLHL